MSQKPSVISEKFFRMQYELLGEQEKKVAQYLAEKKHISRNINTDFSGQLTFGQRMADKVASFGGSWGFITIFALILVVWIALNSYILVHPDRSFDPYPYILLNLFLSMLAAIQAPIILMSQNRQAATDRLSAAHDYEVNLKAELEISVLHEKIDVLREKQWNELVAMQQEQLGLLTQLIENLNRDKVNHDST